MQYQSCDATMTLDEGLHEYYASREGLYDGRGPSKAANDFFRCHDVAHIVFGCSTDLVEEGIVKLWSFFGTTAGLALLRDYNSPESKEIYETISWSVVPGTAVRVLFVAPRVIYRCSRMRRRWPWEDYEAYLPVSLSEIREEFQIRPIELVR